MMKTSFIIPTLNNASTISECLSSLLKHREFIQDIIVIDGNSSDGTLEKLKDFPVKVYSDPGIGQPLACEIGWRNCKGDLIVFFDADAYLGEGFFPKVYDFFSDESMGIVGCEVKVIVTNHISRTESDWWKNSLKRIVQPTAVFQKLHTFVLNASRDGSQENKIVPLGPCQIVTRKCLESVKGYEGVPLNVGTDVSLSLRITNHGWKACWWLNAPVYHHTRNSAKGLVKQFIRWGKEGAYTQRAKEYRNKFSPTAYVISLVGYAMSPLLCIKLAVEYSNPWHIILFPLTRYAWIVGYASAILSRQALQQLRVTPHIKGYQISP